MKGVIKQKSRGRLPTGLVIIALLMIVFGIAEVMTGFTHHFFGITTTENPAFTFAAAAIGGFYIAGGLLILTMKKWAAALAILLLAADIIGRVALVLVGYYPVDTPLRSFAIITGTAIAAVFAIYICLKRELFR